MTTTNDDTHAQLGRAILQAAKARELYMRGAGTADTLIDTNMIISAVPGPELSNRGSRWTGGGTPETDAIGRAIAMSIATLKDADRARVWAVLEKYSGAGWKVDGVGAATSDRGGSVATASLRGIRDATSNVLSGMNEEARKHWDTAANRNRIG